MELFDVLCTRKSVRNYTSQQIADADLEKILVAGGLAPLGLPKAGKPHLTAVQNKALLAQLGSIAGPEHDLLYGAPTLILVSSPDMPMPGLDAANASCVIMNMTMEATDLGLGSIYLLGVAAQLPQHPDVLQQLQLPEGYHPVAALAVGYGTEEPAPSKAWAQTLTVNTVR